MLASRTRLWLLDLGCRHASKQQEPEHEHGHGALTHSTRNVLFNISSAKMYQYDTIRGRTQGICARVKTESTYNMPEKHQIFARPNRTLKIIGTAEEHQHEHHFLLPSRCIDHQHIMRADRTYPMHPANAERWVSFASKTVRFLPNPRNRALQNALYMQCDAV